jgi:hypothetical protein
VTQTNELRKFSDDDLRYILFAIKNGWTLNRYRGSKQDEWWLIKSEHGREDVETQHCKKLHLASLVSCTSTHGNRNTYTLTDKSLALLPFLPKLEADYKTPKQRRHLQELAQHQAGRALMDGFST